MMALIVATNDGLLCNTIKHAVARPRPFVTLPEARVFGVVGKGYVPPEEMAAGQGQPHQHAVVARRQLVRGDDGRVSVLPAQPVVHAAAGAGRFLFAHL